jgi:hypothetical protein
MLTPSIFAMAGLAEAADFFATLIVVGGMCIVGAVMLFAWYRSSWIAALIGFIICLAVGWFFGPWQAIAAQPTIAPPDPDELHWISMWRLIALVWCACFLACVSLFPFIVRRSKRYA